MKNILSEHKKLVYTLSAIVGALVLILVSTFFISLPTTPIGVITEPTKYILKEAANIPSLQKTTIGKTTTQEIEALPNITKTPNSAYSYPSYLIKRSNEIKTENNLASLERVLVPISSDDPNYITITQLTERFGKPDKIIRGSKFYGDFPSTYIYATQGMAFIGNPNTNEVYEVQFFSPMTPDEYQTKYGEDIVKDSKAATENHGQ